MNKKLIVLLILLLLSFPVRIHAEEYINDETNYRAIIEDDADILADYEEDALLEEMMPLTEYGNVMFKSIDYNETDTETFVRRYYYQVFGADTGSLFIIDMDNRQVYLLSDGRSKDIVNVDKAEVIVDNCYTYAGRGDYYGCASIVFDQVYKTLNGEKIAEPMRVITNSLMSLIIALLINFIFANAVSAVRKTKDSVIVRQAVRKFEVKDHKVKTYGPYKEYDPIVDTSSSGGSGGSGYSGGSSGGYSGGGGSSGGSSSGSGAGHSF